jgi:hypothetical protein
MGAEGSGMLSLRALNTITVTLAIGLVALAGWHFQNPGHFELIQVPRSPLRSTVRSCGAKRCAGQGSATASAEAHCGSV